MFGNCPWNFNSSILANSVAERQAQKRKIRNGRLPIPKLIKKSKVTDVAYGRSSSKEHCNTIPDSLLPDTVVLSEESNEEENFAKLSEECCDLSGSVTKDSACDISALSVVQNDTLFTVLGNTSKSCSFVDLDSSSKLKCDTSVISDVCDYEEHKNLKNYNDVFAFRAEIRRRGYIDLNDSPFLGKISLERKDGCVLKLGFHDCFCKVVTVVQENGITFWECFPASSSFYQFVWLKKGYLPVLRNTTFAEFSCKNVYASESMWEIGLKPDGWKSVVLVIDPNVNSASVYAYSCSGTTKMNRNLTITPRTFKNSKEFNACVLDSTKIVVWCNAESKGTALRKYLLNDSLTELVEMKEFVGVESNIKSLYHVNASKPAVIGIDEEFQLFIWNHITGNIIRCIDLLTFTMYSCIGMVEDQGYLFTLANGKSGNVHLLVVNISSERWSVLKTYSSDFKGCVSGYKIHSGLLLAAYHDGLVVWDMQSEMQLTCFSPQKKCEPLMFPCGTIFKTDCHVLYILDDSAIF